MSVESSLSRASNPVTASVLIEENQITLLNCGCQTWTLSERVTQFKRSTKNTRYDTLTAPDLKGPDVRLTFEGFENCFSLRGAHQLHSDRVLRIIDTDPKHRNASSPPSNHK